MLKAGNSVKGLIVIESVYYGILCSWYFNNIITSFYQVYKDSQFVPPNESGL